MKLKAAFHTLGCKVNQYETEAIKEEFIKCGYEIVEFHDIADVYIINTCSVTGESERKSRQMIRRAMSANKDAVIAVTGCYTQVAPDKVKSFTDADIITGTANKLKLVQKVNNFMKTKQRIISISDIADEKNFEQGFITGYNEKTRAFVKIEDGCDNFCSYCIIPYARGRVRSKPLYDAYNEISGLVARGYKEIVLTGIHLDSYGKDFDKPSALVDLLELCAEIEGLSRVRLGSLEPVFITAENVDRLSKINNLCPHFHLSLQSGCDATLKRMNRKYLTADFEKAVNLLRAAFEDCAITTDIIVGFPGETDEEFEQSKEFVSKISFSSAHIFVYSRRPGTAAYDMKEQVPKATKKARSEDLIRITTQDKLSFYNSQIGKEVCVLFEKGKDNVYEGFTANYIPVKVKSNSTITNSEKRVKIERASVDYCQGIII